MGRNSPFTYSTNNREKGSIPSQETLIKAIRDSLSHFPLHILLSYYNYWSVFLSLSTLLIDFRYLTANDISNRRCSRKRKKRAVQA